jgi:hypothetical protein
MLSKFEAVNAGDFEHASNTNADGTPVRARRNGRTQTWVTREQEYSIPVKYGLKNAFRIESGAQSEGWRAVNMQAFEAREVRLIDGLTGVAVKRSRNLRGLREWVSRLQDGCTVGRVSIYHNSTWKGSGVLRVEWHYHRLLCVRFYCQVPFASYAVLCNSLREWRNLYGVELFINGKRSGFVAYDNAELIKA